VIHAIDMPSIPLVMRTKRWPVPIEDFVDERGVFHPPRLEGHATPPQAPSYQALTWHTAKTRGAPPFY